VFPADLEVALEVVDLVVWRVGHQVTVHRDYLLRVVLLLGVSDCLPEFPVGLPVQLVSPDEHRAALLGRVQQDQIRGDALVLVHLDDVADLHLRRGHMCIMPLRSQPLIPLVIEFLVSLPPLQVVPGLLHQGHCENEGQGCYVGEEEADFEGWDQLRQAD